MRISHGPWEDQVGKGPQALGRHPKGDWEQVANEKTMTLPSPQSNKVQSLLPLFSESSGDITTNIPQTQQ